ncbi:MAG: thiamine pyrophosphate-dependent enzyme [Kiritimatiellae bacterium]|nr:thiamine pyrophosphate-dependent enzyme [Kiritimatiellia bacterium]
MSVSTADYASSVPIAWCPGCGNFAILNAVKKSLSELDLPPDRVVICTGIGQAPKLPHYLRVNTFNGLHGREIASAIGIKLAANDLTVIVHAGEGGAYGEGGNHFLHAIRRNMDLTVVVHDNLNYALTKGQASPTTPAGTVKRLQPEGVASQPLNPLALAISQSCSFVGQGTSARADLLAGLLKAAIRHRGFSLVHILQTCPSWDRIHTPQFYKEHCYELGEDYDPQDRDAALRLVMTPEDRHPLGILYLEERPLYNESALHEIEQPLRGRLVEPETADQVLKQLAAKTK